MSFLLALITRPLSWIYALFIGLRNIAYDHGICTSHTVDIPTICVGNLAVGGTGKTPMIEYLIRLLAPRYRIAVLSRGYGRKSKGFVMANHRSTTDTIGDEMMQMHTKFPHIPMAVCADRVKGIKQLKLQHSDLQLILLDDAYQHRRLQCGFYILLTPYNRLYVNDHMLPYGRLREPAFESRRANAIIVTKCPDSMSAIDRRVVTNALQLPAYQELYFSSICYATVDISPKPLVLTGIAHPEYLVDYIRSFAPHAELLAYPDHHRFTKRDIRRITAQAQHFPQVLTTEKDYMRLLSCNLPEPLLSKLQVIPIQVQFFEQQAQDLDRQITMYIHEQLNR